MLAKLIHYKFMVILIAAALVIALGGIFAATLSASPVDILGSDRDGEREGMATGTLRALESAQLPNAPCSGGPAVDGITFDECYVHNFTAGGDPKTRRRFWDMLYEMSGEGKTSFVTTHYMEEAERCTKLGFIFNGELIAIGTPAEVKSGNETLEEAFLRLTRDRL